MEGGGRRAVVLWRVVGRWQVKVAGGGCMHAESDQAVRHCCSPVCWCPAHRGGGLVNGLHGHGLGRWVAAGGLC